MSDPAFRAFRDEWRRDAVMKGRSRNWTRRILDGAAVLEAALCPQTWSSVCRSGDQLIEEHDVAGNPVAQFELYFEMQRLFHHAIMGESDSRWRALLPVSDYYESLAYRQAITALGLHYGHALPRVEKSPLLPGFAALRGQRDAKPFFERLWATLDSAQSRSG